MKELLHLNEIKNGSAPGPALLQGTGIQNTGTLKQLSMAAKYRYCRTPQKKDDPEQNIRIHPRMLKSETITLPKLCEYITSMSTFTPGDAQGVMTQMAKIILDLLLEGHPVQWDGFGTFTLILTADPPDEPGKEPRKIRVKRILFRPTREIKLKLEYIELQRKGDTTDLAFAAGIREKNILDHLEKNRFIQSSDCAKINNCSRSTGVRDLKKLVEKGMIQEKGRHRTSTFYVLPENNESE